MPFYDYKCKTCGYTEEDRLEKPDNTIISCPMCEEYMQRLLHSNYGINMGPVGAYGYYDENLGKYINTNKERNDEMRRQGVVEKGATPKNEGTWI